MMRHKLSYDLFKSLSTAQNPRFAAASRFVEVQFNGKYQGAYLLMERVDRAMFGLRPYNSNEVTHSCIYKAVDHSANFGQPGHAGYEQREPDPLARAYWQPLDRLNKMVSTAPDAQFYNSTTGIVSRVDLDNAIDFHLLVLLTSNMDGITKNFIVAADAPTTPATRPRFFFAPWDYDATFGRNWDATPVPPSAWLSNHLFERLLRDRGYREKFAARWNELREHAFSPKTIQAMIDANVHDLGAAAERNAARWPTSTGPYPDKLTFAEDIAQMKSWIENRAQWLDKEIHRQAGQK
jgi:spore coat protein H